MTAARPSPSTTVAILLGASSWPNCSPLKDQEEREADRVNRAGHGYTPGQVYWRSYQAVRACLQDYFSDPDELGEGPDNILDLFDACEDGSPLLQSRLAEAIKEFLKPWLERTGAGTGLTDVWVVFIGHGTRYPPGNAGETYLIPGSGDSRYPANTGLSFKLIDDMLKDAG